jgi:hypothetical protein
VPAPTAPPPPVEAPLPTAAAALPLPAVTACEPALPTRAAPPSPASSFAAGMLSVTDRVIRASCDDGTARNGRRDFDGLAVVAAAAAEPLAAVLVAISLDNSSSGANDGSIGMPGDDGDSADSAVPSSGDRSDAPAARSACCERTLTGVVPTLGADSLLRRYRAPEDDSGSDGIIVGAVTRPVDAGPDDVEPSPPPPPPPPPPPRPPPPPPAPGPKSCTTPHTGDQHREAL